MSFAICAYACHWGDVPLSPFARTSAPRPCVNPGTRAPPAGMSWHQRPKRHGPGRHAAGVTPLLGDCGPAPGGAPRAPIGGCPTPNAPAASNLLLTMLVSPARRLPENKQPPCQQRGPAMSASFAWPRHHRYGESMLYGEPMATFAQRWRASRNSQRAAHAARPNQLVYSQVVIILA